MEKYYLPVKDKQQAKQIKTWILEQFDRGIERVSLAQIREYADVGVVDGYVYDDYKKGYYVSDRDDIKKAQTRVIDMPIIDSLKEGTKSLMNDIRVLILPEPMKFPEKVDLTKKSGLTIDNDGLTFTEVFPDDKVWIDYLIGECREALKKANDYRRKCTVWRDGVEHRGYWHPPFITNIVENRRDRGPIYQTLAMVEFLDGHFERVDYKNFKVKEWE